MLYKKRNIINIAMIIGLLGAQACLAAETNNLVQLDLKRTSDSSVDVTLVTSDTYNDNVMVRQKSENKYVILIPKVKTAGYRASNLASVHDMVFNVDVKTVEDTSGGYTKVTLITKKPIDIKTRTMKSMPLSAEQQEYNTLISQANTIKNNIGKVDYKSLNNPKTEVTVNKTPDIIKSEPVKQTVKKDVQKQIELTEIVPENINKLKEQKASNTKSNDIKAQDKALEELPAIPEQLNEIANNELQKSDTPKHKIPSKLPKALGISLGCFALLSLLSKMFKKSAIQTAYEPQKAEFAENISPAQAAVEKEYYDNLANNTELSWREKYKLYTDKSAQPVKRANKKGSYSFIKTPAKFDIDEKRESLERMIKPDELSHSQEISTSHVHSEDATIAKTIKFKAFANNNTSLEMTNRNKNSRFKRYEVELPLHEQNTVNLDESPLYASARNLKSANLQISDVDSRRIKYEPSEYIMSSVEEYFSILDNEQKQIQEKSSNILPETSAKREHMTSPMAQSEKQSMLKGSVVKSRFKIDADKGIYLVNKEGKNTLVGKINDKMFVLKDFEGKVTNPIQVRHDNDNVYMVKAGDFKSLVEVDEDKMGVLIEL